MCGKKEGIKKFSESFFWRREKSSLSRGVQRAFNLLNLSSISSLLRCASEIYFAGSFTVSLISFDKN
jgi:hypothetical protein